MIFRQFIKHVVDEDQATLTKQFKSQEQRYIREKKLKICSVLKDLACTEQKYFRSVYLLIG